MAILSYSPCYRSVTIEPLSRDEFTKHGMTMVHLSHRNVCQQGFALLDIADAGRWRSSETAGSPHNLLYLVFLDLPAPWEAIPHAKVALKVRIDASTLPITNRRLTRASIEGPSGANMLF